MEKYYLISWKEGKDPVASAFAPKGSKSGNELILALNGINKVPFELKMVKVDVGKSGIIVTDDLSGLKEIWLDYQPNNLAWPLMSEKLKAVIESNLSGLEQLDWIECRLNGVNEDRTYFIPRFNILLDVLDRQKTMFVFGTDHIIKPVFEGSKIRSYSIFPKPLSHDLWKITPGLYVSDALKQTMQKAKISGMVFEKVSVS
ncbi:MAG: hypothetical protein H6581_25500 [Bacteroidia bacterium]|nr:hypothetical protein [Bacteroidia bacterium]